MRHRTFIVALGVVVLTALVTGCAGVGSRIDGSASGNASDLPGALELSGAWQGSYWQLPMGNSYADAADCTLRINEDATFTASCARPLIGTNNLAKASSWSGRVVTHGNRITLQGNGGPWPWIVLTRSGADTLYGVTLDPQVGATVEMEFERESMPAATPRGN